jgi:uncharacterized protein YecE (DUF72 family)
MTINAVSHQDFDYAVEFRHRSWLDESKKEMDAATLEALVAVFAEDG